MHVWIALEIYSTTIEWIRLAIYSLSVQKKFINRLHLIFYACVQIFDVMFLNVKILDDPKGQTPVHVVASIVYFRWWKLKQDKAGLAPTPCMLAAIRAAAGAGPGQKLHAYGKIKVTIHREKEHPCLCILSSISAFIFSPPY